VKYTIFEIYSKFVLERKDVLVNYIGVCGAITVDFCQKIM